MGQPICSKEEPIIMKEELKMVCVKPESDNANLFVEMATLNFTPEEKGYERINYYANYAIELNSAFIIKLNDKPIGTVSVRASNRFTEVCIFSINKDMRGKGYGGIIMNSICGEFDNVMVSIGDDLSWKYEFYRRFNVSIMIGPRAN